MEEVAHFYDERLVVATGDITTFTGDAIVNAANSSLLGGGGVDGAIHAAGGGAILSACREIRRSIYPDGMPTGEAVATTAGDMRCHHVIHTVGPVWHGGGRGEKEDLAKAYASSLRVAIGKGASSIAFPAISTGVYGFPKKLAASVVHATIGEFLSNHDSPARIYLVFFAASDAQLYIEAVG